ncbi:hypothetical protein J2752_002216 [Halarchaeum rubridurum]|uniref:DUF2795 domain-containing protein n=1 Tax=Halarchaeum rubridurum TaxID=489911 RepID=A0A830G1M2_9EURY|nr:hypothetical protein [Halarchaeum rubridurum]MBP1955293.1 hypothetical protein [Halarchaeum rubridurum]GGM71084.1 hypothetical protein GCM10009017_21490 [Halarchaeum rubridurum]
MTERVKLKDLEDALEGLPYPLSKQNAVAEVEGIVLVYADGEETAADVVERIEEEVFDDPASLAASIRNNLPTEAVGEPGQSEGEG